MLGLIQNNICDVLVHRSTYERDVTDGPWNLRINFVDVKYLGAGRRSLSVIIQYTYGNLRLNSKYDCELGEVALTADKRRMRNFEEIDMLTGDFVNQLFIRGYSEITYKHLNTCLVLDLLNVNITSMSIAMFSQGLSRAYSERLLAVGDIQFDDAVWIRHGMADVPDGESDGESDDESDDDADNHARTVYSDNITLLGGADRAGSGCLRSIVRVLMPWRARA